MPSSETAGVSSLRAFSLEPDKMDAAELVYTSRLTAEADIARQQEYALLNQVWESEPGSIQEEERARKAALGYLVLSAEQLHYASPQRRQALSEQLTLRTTEIYGAPDPAEAQQCAARMAQDLKVHIGSPHVDQNRLTNVIQFWETSPPAIETKSLDAEYKVARTAMHQVLHELFGPALAALDLEDVGQSSLGPEDIVTSFERAMAILAEDEPAWKEWKAVLIDSSSFSVSATTKSINVGQHRVTLEAGELQPLFCHEVLVHALRWIQSKKFEEPLLRKALPGYLDAEEGLAIFMEYAAGGELPVRIFDRYADTAAALGFLGKPAVSRRELQGLYLDRLIVRQQIAGELVDEAALTHAAWAHVNRIYRGSLGNEIIGVHTKDIAYYQGFIKIGRYITQKLETGEDPTALFNYLTSGKFDPTNPRHTALLDHYTV